MLVSFSFCRLSERVSGSEGNIPPAAPPIIFTRKLYWTHPCPQQIPTNITPEIPRLKGKDGDLLGEKKLQGFSRFGPLNFLF